MIENRTGQQFGNYRLIRFLGQGGFADVYLGEHIHLGTQAAIKVLHAQLMSEDVNEFRTEARTIAHLAHPNIVRVLEFGVEGKIPFLVMDHAPNGTLRQRHQKGSRLPVELVLSYVQQIASALQYAHGQRLIHRDIKPENMLLGRADEILLSDFGLALFAQSTSSQSTKGMAGTVAYMAPEQIVGKPRPASDQYALGVVVYEWLSGERPFQGTPHEIVGQHLSASPPPLSGRIPGVSPAVEKVVLTALTKESEKRFPTVQAFAAALEQAVLYGSFPASPPRSSSLLNYAPQQSLSTSALPYQSPPLGEPPRDSSSPSASSQSSSYVPQPSLSTSAPPYQPQSPMGGVAWGNSLGQTGWQRGNPVVPPPPPPGPIMSNPNNVNTPSFGTVSGQSSPQVSSAPPVQQKKPKRNVGSMIAVIVIVVMLIAVTGLGATYFFAHKPTASTGSGTQGLGAQSQPTTPPAPQAGTPTTVPAATTATTATTASTVPTDTPTPQADTPTPQATVTTAPTGAWGPETKNQQLTCIANCSDTKADFNVSLSSITLDPKLNTMLWTFAITDRGDVCTDLSGTIKLLDPAGREIDPSGGTFIDRSSINMGQTLPKSASFSTLPRSGVLYEVDITVRCGYYSTDIYQPEHFQL